VGKKVKKCGFGNQGRIHQRPGQLRNISCKLKVKDLRKKTITPERHRRKSSTGSAQREEGSFNMGGKTCHYLGPEKDEMVKIDGDG